MIYTEKMKRQINAAGFQVIEVKWLVKHLMEAVKTLAEAIGKMIEQIKAIFNNLLDLHDAIMSMPPRQRYKLCRKLGIKNYQCFFQRRWVYRTRSCC